MKSLGSRIADLLCPTRKLYREVRQAEADRVARVMRHAEKWNAAHPGLAAHGVPPPPSADSMMRFGVYFGGVFYQP